MFTPLFSVLHDERHTIITGHEAWKYFGGFEISRPYEGVLVRMGDLCEERLSGGYWLHITNTS